MSFRILYLTFVFFISALSLSMLVLSSAVLTLAGFSAGQRPVIASERKRAWQSLLIGAIAVKPLLEQLASMG